MNRRRFIATTTGLLAVPLGARVQAADRVPKVGLVTFSPETRDAFVAGLEELGYQDGRNIMIDWRRPRSGDAPSDLEDLVRLKPDCLLLAGPNNLAAGRKLTTTIPIIAVDLETDPVSSGLAASLAHPGGNVTGVFLDLPELAGKQIQLLREAVPTLTRLAILVDERVSDAQLRAAQIAAQAAGVSLDPIGVRNAADLDNAISRAMKSRPQALLVLTGPFFFSNLDRIANGAQRHRLPSGSIFPAMARAGGLLGYGPNQGQLFKQAAKYVDRILKGARPADLPIERPTSFQLVINLKTAKALGLTIPQSVLLRADEVIQ
jgi:putative tryptophan/tyrosine transport system substrate-binding protein